MPLPAVRSIDSDLQLPPAARVENTSRTGDETYSPSNGKPSRGSEDDSDDASEDDLDEFELLAATEDELDEFEGPAPDEDEPATQPAALDPTRPVSFFA
jgi:hypothetical protein